MDKDIVLIPGSLATPKLWKYQTALFQTKGRIHHADLLSTGSIADMAQHLANHAPRQFTLIAFSMGGYIALELFRYIPNSIEKLILINASARELCERGKAERSRSIELVNKGKFDFLVNRIFKNSIYDAADYVQLLPLLKEMAYAIGSDHYKNQLQAMIDKHDQTDILTDIQCPTLLISAKQDQVMPYERSEHLATYIPHAELVYLQRCGHQALLEKPEEMNTILNDWL